MPPVDTTVLDSLDRSNASTLGTGWAAAFTAPSCNIDTNAARAQASSYCANYRDSDTVGPLAMCGLNVGVLAGGDSFASLRASLIAASPTSASWNGYQLLVYAARVVLARIDAGSDTELINYTASAPQAGDDYIVERTTDAGAWELWRRRSGTWTSLGTATDDTYETTFRVGIDIYDPSSAGRLASVFGATLVVGEAPAFTVTPAVTGSPYIGEVLTCDGGTATGDPAPTKTYQWKVNGSDITGENASTYTIDDADLDVGDAVTCTVTATNTAGSDSDTSNSVTILETPTGPEPNCFLMTAGGLVSCVSRVMTAGGLFPPVA